MKKQNEVYFNFPIQLLDGFLRDSQTQLEFILNYHLYAHSLKLDAGDELKNFIDSAKYWNVELGNEELAFDDGKMVYDSLPDNSPMTGISEAVFWDYFQNFKTDFEKACFIAFVALKSILGTKPYAKITNAYLLSRMDGKPKVSKDVLNLSDEVKQYSTRYRLDKIKEELQNSWGLVYYSHYTRGFYISFKLTIEKLVYEAEKKRKSNKEKKRKELKNQARKKALDQLFNNNTK